MKFSMKFAKYFAKHVSMYVSAELLKYLNFKSKSGGSPVPD